MGLERRWVWEKALSNSKERHNALYRGYVTNLKGREGFTLERSIVLSACVVAAPMLSDLLYAYSLLIYLLPDLPLVHMVPKPKAGRVGF